MARQYWIVIGTCLAIGGGSVAVSQAPPTTGFIGWVSSIGAVFTCLLCAQTAAAAICFGRSHHRSGVLGAILRNTVNTLEFWFLFIALLIPAGLGVVVQTAKIVVMLTGS